MVAEGCNTNTESTGIMPWLIWGSASLFFLYEYLQRVAPSVMVDDLMRAFAIEGAEVGELGAFYYYAYAILQIPVGVLADRYGPRRPLVLAALLCVVGSVLFAMAHGFAFAALGRLLIGTGSGFAFVCCLRLAANWFPERHFGLLVGLTNMLGMVGAVSGEAPLAAIVDQFNWRETFFLLAALALVLAVLILVVVRDHPKAPVIEEEFQEENWARLFADLRVVMGNGQTWLNGLYGGCINAPLAAFGALWGVSFMGEIYGLSKEAAAASISLLFVGCLLGSAFYGWISDRLQRRKMPMIISGILSLVVTVPLLYLSGLPLWLANIMLFFLGFMGQGPVLAYAASREWNPPAAAGISSGMINTMLIGIGAASQPLVGWLLDLHWDGKMKGNAPEYTDSDFHFAMTSIIVLVIVGILAGFFVRETNCRQQEGPSVGRGPIVKR